MTGPFGVLGLPPGPGLSDDEVRVAWRRVAAATHPDRADGGDPAAFAAAAAAYTLLRTPAGRAEALANLRADGPKARGHVPILMRPWRLALRTLAVLAASGVAVAAVGWQPASAAVTTGALTWLVLTGRGDLGRRRP